jgi:hypothetical protein
MIRVPASIHRLTIAISFFTSGGEASWVRATEMSMQSIAIAQDYHEGIAVSWVAPSDRCVRLTAMSPTVVVASGHTDQGTYALAGAGVTSA